MCCTNKDGSWSLRKGAAMFISIMYAPFVLVAAFGIYDASLPRTIYRDDFFRLYVTLYCVVLFGSMILVVVAFLLSYVIEFAILRCLRIDWPGLLRRVKTIFN